MKTATTTKRNISEFKTIVVLKISSNKKFIKIASTVSNIKK